jgi:hypothetical protein
MKGKSVLVGGAIALLASGCGSSSKSPTTATANVKPLRVVSSINDGAALSSPLRWRAMPAGLGRKNVTAVQFLIDGRVAWTEHQAPYAFNEDDGLLYPSLIGAGKHSLGVRVRMADGSRASSSSNVTVAAQPALPAAVVGDWERRVTAADIARTQSERGNDGGPPPGKWKLHIIRNGLIRFDDPMGSGGVEAAAASTPTTLTLEGPPNWLVPKSRQGGFCGPEPTTGYRITAADGRLTLLGHDPSCPDRESIFDGTWTRIP